MEHETPSAEIFNEMKKAAIEIWQTYDDTCGYASEKIATVNNITNFKDNVMICYRMFDSSNQAKMKYGVSREAIIYINDNL
jgi:hypothetical protein